MQILNITFPYLYVLFSGSVTQEASYGLCLSPWLGVLQAAEYVIVRGRDV
jgi:hypothetical protein